MGLKKIRSSTLVEPGNGVLFKPDGELVLSPQDFARLADIIEADFNLTLQIYRKNKPVNNDDNGWKDARALSS